MNVWLEIIIQVLQSVLENCPQQRRDRDSIRKMITKPSWGQKLLFRRELRKQADENLDKLQDGFASSPDDWDVEYLVDRIMQG